MLTDEAWIRGEIECCDTYPCDHSRMMKAALTELLAAREVVRAAKELNQYETEGADEEPPHLYWEEHYMALAESVKHYDEATR